MTRKAGALGVGDQVEFLSSENGGTWKRGVVVKSSAEVHGNESFVRIQVGDGVWVTRPASKCRKAECPTSPPKE